MLARLPILERATLQADPEAFHDRRRPSIEIHTSGSTATPLTYYLDRAARRRRLAQYARFFWLHGWRPWHASLTFKVLPDSSDRVGSSWLDRTLLGRRRVVSVLDPPAMHLDALRRRDPVILHGLPSSFEQLGLELRRQDWRPGRLQRIFTSSEALSREQRSFLEETFGAPVVDHYGAAEGLIGWECRERHGYHLNVRSIFVEIVDEAGVAIAPGDTGRILITTLDNPAMPLLRYALGDWAVRGDGRPCPCGRAEPLLPRVIGRAVEVFQLPCGPTSPWGLLVRMREVPGLMRFQLIQTGPMHVEVRIQSANAAQPADPRRVADLVRETFATPLQLEVRETHEFLKLPSGKFAPALRLRERS